MTGDGDTAAINTVSDASPDENRGARTYTFDVGDATVVDIALIPADEVTVDENGVVTFGDNEGTANEADDLGNAGGAVIETVNGVDVADDDYINNVSVTNGTVTFSVDSTTPNITVRPVVLVDADNDNQLDLDADDALTEDFGVGGTKQWIRTEAAAGTPTTADALIELVNKDQDFFSTQDGTFYYDANDQFRIATDDTATCVPVSMANFEASLSTNDELEDEVTNYSQDEEASSVFCINDVAPAQVTGVDAQTVDEDTIKVTWTAVAGADSYNVYRVTDTTPATDCPTTGYTQVATVTTTEYTDDGLSPDTTYCYRVAAVADGDEGAQSAADTGGDDANDAKATTSPAGTTAAPQSDDARLVTDTGFVGEADAGDVWRVGEATAVIRVQDADGEFENVDCATAEATCTTNNSAVTIGTTTYAAGRVLTVELGAIGTPDGDADANATNNDAALQYPLTITTQSGITDATGNAWTPADDPDNVIDDEGTQTVTQIPPTFQSATADDTTEKITLVFNELIVCADLTTDDYTVTGATDGTVTAVACEDGLATNDETIVVTVTSLLDGETPTTTATAANNVKDLDGNEQPTGDSETSSAA